ncbi:MAG TPA: flotillin [Verrucomicrobia bacterium]|nr:MAG: flotillin [Lentisphaerae bacterium GWF2_57_35]HBA85644.1 flotillin [Verrucomicrobiota bacterium]
MWPVVILAFVILIVSTILFLAARYKRCPSDRILVIYGKVADNRSSKCVHGGGTMVWPLIQDYSYLSLTPMTISIPLQNALSLQNIRINVPSTFTVGISTDPNIMLNAAERLLGLESGDIEAMAKEIIFGQLRLTVASLTIEQINQDRESFLESIRKNVEPELNKIGLYLINVNITDITDESTYIESIGKKAASEAINKARVDVAIQEKYGAIGQAENVAAAEKGKKKAEADQRIYVQGQEAEAVTGENTAKAQIADSNAQLATKQAAAMQKAEVAKREAQVQIQKAQYLAEAERLNAEEVVQKEIDRRKIEISAEAEAERMRREAKGQADGILYKYEAEAKGLRQVLESKAAGYASLVKSCNGDAKAAATFLMVEKLEDIVAKQVEAISHLKIDKITVWDSSNGEGKGSSTANFVSSLIKSVPPLQDVASMAGVELPDYLGRMVDDRIKKTSIDSIPKN